MSAPSVSPLGANVAGVIPCYNEVEAIDGVVAAVLAQGVQSVVVVDGGSTDGTAERAAAVGAQVVIERRRGYGRALLCGLAVLPPDATIVLFLDGDGTDRTECIPDLIRPIVEGKADFVTGSRLEGACEPGSLSFSQILAGRIAGLLLRVLYDVRFTDMSPYRAIRRDCLPGLGMRETTFGWNLEMLMRVAAAGHRSLEIPVGQRRRRSGRSKVSGRLGASIKAAWTLMTVFVRLAIELYRRDRSAAR